MSSPQQSAVPLYNAHAETLLNMTCVPLAVSRAAAFLQRPRGWKCGRGHASRYSGGTCRQAPSAKNAAVFGPWNGPAPASLVVRYVKPGEKEGPACP